MAARYSRQAFACRHLGGLRLPANRPDERRETADQRGKRDEESGIEDEHDLRLHRPMFTICSLFSIGEFLWRKRFNSTGAALVQRSRLVGALGFPYFYPESRNARRGTEGISIMLKLMI